MYFNVTYAHALLEKHTFDNNMRSQYHYSYCRSYGVKHLRNSNLNDVQKFTLNNI